MIIFFQRLDILSNFLFPGRGPMAYGCAIYRKQLLKSLKLTGKADAIRLLS
ncbi:hypothetical protein AAULR_24441, partial [Lacticaseibacillus rhamnosus MTCC 5462]